MKELRNHKDFTKAITNGVTLVDFNALWCGPCRFQEPILEKIVKYYEGKAAIVSMNIDQNYETANILGIKSIPTLVIYKNGKEIIRFVGLQSEEILIEAINKII